MFVSWKRDGHHLRGCLGTFVAKPLREALSEYAIASATRDVRFPPVQRSEIPRLCVGVSLLDDFEEAADLWDWSPGLHGVSIEFKRGTKSYRATFLPEVIVEQGWSKQETLSGLLHKSGYHGTHSRDLLDDISLTRYKSIKSTLSYQDYLNIDL